MYLRAQLSSSRGSHFRLHEHMWTMKTFYQMAIYSLALGYFTILKCYSSSQKQIARVRKGNDFSTERKTPSKRLGMPQIYTLRLPKLENERHANDILHREKTHFNVFQKSIRGMICALSKARIVLFCFCLFSCCGSFCRLLC